MIARVAVVSTISMLSYLISAHGGDGPRYELVSKVKVARCGVPSREAVLYLVWPHCTAAEVARITDVDWHQRLASGVVIQAQVLGTREVVWPLLILDQSPTVGPWKPATSPIMQTFFYSGTADCRTLRHGQILQAASWSTICDTCEDPFDWSRFLRPVPSDTAEWLGRADRAPNTTQRSGVARRPN